MSVDRLRDQLAAVKAWYNSKDEDKPKTYGGLTRRKARELILSLSKRIGAIENGEASVVDEECPKRRCPKKRDLTFSFLARHGMVHDYRMDETDRDG